MIVIKVIKNHLTPLKKSDYTKIHNLRDTLHRPLTATSEQSVFSWQNYYGFTGYDGGDFFLVYSSRLQRFLILSAMSDMAWTLSMILTGPNQRRTLPI